MYYLVAGLLIIIFYINIVASYHLLCAHCYDSIQKSIQLLIIWLVPIIGGIVVMAFIVEQPTARVDGSRSASRIMHMLLLSFLLDSTNTTNDGVSNETSSDSGFADGADIGNGDGTGE